MNLPADVVQLAAKIELPKPMSVVYFLMRQGECVYVGQTRNLQQRLRCHTDKDYDEVHFVDVPEELRLSTEREYIAKLAPVYNGTLGRPNTRSDELRVYVSVRLPRNLLNRLNRYAAKKQVTRTAVIEEAIEKLI